MKIVISHDIYFETKTGNILPTKVSFTDINDAQKYISIENSKETSFGKYFYKVNSRVCYETYEEYITAQKNAGIGR